MSNPTTGRIRILQNPHYTRGNRHKDGFPLFRRILKHLQKDRLKYIVVDRRFEELKSDSSLLFKDDEPFWEITW